MENRHFRQRTNVHHRLQQDKRPDVIFLLAFFDRQSFVILTSYVRAPPNLQHTRRPVVRRRAERRGFAPVSLRASRGARLSMMHACIALIDARCTGTGYEDEKEDCRL